MPPERRFAPEDFSPCGAQIVDVEPAPPSPGFWREAWSHLRRDRVAMICLAFLLCVVLGALLLPLISPFDYDRQNVALSNLSPGSPDPAGNAHLFGTDHLGRDIFVRMWYGVRVSVGVALAAALIDCVVGIVYGGLSGYLGGWVDNILMRLLEIIGGIPYLVVVLLLAAVLPRGILSLIIAYSLVGWTGMARLTRGQVIRLKQQDFMVAARIMGAGPLHILSRHLMPNLMSLVLTSVTLDIPAVIFTEAFLSMLGLGVPPPYPSLGVMIKDALAVFQLYPSQLAIPTALLCLIMLAFNLFGDRLQDALDSKLRRSTGRAGASNH